MKGLRRRCLASLAVLAATAGTIAPAAAQDDHHDQDGVFTHEQVSDRAHVLYGRGGNIGFIVTDDGVVVIDTQFAEIAPGAVEQIREVTDQPIRYIINTHVHGDHVGGNPVFQEYGDIVAHENTFDRLYHERELTALPGREEGLPQVVFQKELTFYVGGLEIQAIHLAAGHTDTDVVVWIPGENVVHMGDLLFNEIIPVVDVARGAHTGEWMEFIAGIYQIIDEETVVIPGHGKVTDRTGLERMHDYFRTIRTRVSQRHAMGESKEEILATDFSGESFATWDRMERLDTTVNAVYIELAGGDRTLVVVNKLDDEVAFVDVETNMIRGKARTGPNPHEVAVTPDGKTAYVSNYGTGRPPGSRCWLTVVDVQRMQAVRDLELIAPETGIYLAQPHGLAIDGAGNSLWVTVEGSRAVARIALPEEEITGIYETDQQVSHMVALTPDGGKAYVANIGSGSVSVIDAASGDVKSVACQSGTEGIACSPDGRWVWATNRVAGTISVIDTSTDDVAETLEAGEMAIRVKFTHDGTKALVTNARDGNLAVYDVATRELVRTVKTRALPVGILILPDDSRAYIANTRSDVITILDLGEWKEIGTLETGRASDGMDVAVTGG